MLKQAPDFFDSVKVGVLALAVVKRSQYLLDRLQVCILHQCFKLIVHSDQLILFRLLHRLGIS